MTTGALATTAVVKTNPGGLTAVGPVNSQYGFPSWYQDKNGKRVELCLDGNDPMCGFVAAPVAGFDNTQPTVFPTNFPSEAFYMNAASTLTLPNGGKAVLTLSLEGAFVNNAVKNGDQIAFARQRIFVTNGPTSSTLHFHEPYSDIDVDTDSTGRAHFTEDIAPSVGNFDTPLKGDLGPFLTWDTGPVTTPSGQYLGDPAVAHAVTGGPNGNVFSVDYTDATGAQTATQTGFTVQGKLSTNTGVKADAAVQTTDASGNPVIDVFATSEADPGELYVAADTAAGIKTTPMATSQTAAGPKSFYARVAMTGTAPANVTVNNIGDAPTSSGAVPVTKQSGIVVTSATFDGTNMKVSATSASPTAALGVTGYGPLTNGSGSWATSAPPAQVTVTDGTGGSASATVQVLGGAVTPPGEPPVAGSTAPVAPVCTQLDPTTGQDVVVPCTNGAPPAGATPTAKVAAVTAPVALGDSVTLDASTSTNATSYEWTSVSGPQVTFTNGTTAKPTVKLTPYDVSKYTSGNLPKAAQSAPAVVQVVAVNGTTKSAPVTVSIPVKTDGITTTTLKYTAGKEYRVDGTSTVPGGSLVLNPPTTVALYNTTSGKLVGTAQVDTTGAWSVRLRSPFAAGQDLAQKITMVASRGGYATATVPGAPN